MTEPAGTRATALPLGRTLGALVCLLIAGPLALPARAADLPDSLLRSGGSLTASNCTAVLIAPDAVLTAGHCATSGHGTFFAGWQGGVAPQMRRGTNARRPALPPLAANRYHADQARLTLARPFAGVAPARPGPPPAPGTHVTVASYPKGAPEPQLATCRVLSRPGTEIVLDCPARSGMSGAPLFQSGRLVGLLTNRIGRDRSLATTIADDLLE